jgi:hypothetical protein
MSRWSRGEAQIEQQLRAGELATKLLPHLGLF